ncbi:hypothetical protein [Microbacterium luticocti]|uniref:hypothetical protein n=1 Tax=Microbacterium luticocti TaxID=451764 RepID=UPI000420BF35|nr:hypothetical protein [Microbacterium luticocti]
MRKYVFGTGIIGAVTSGMTLLRALRDKEPFTWRTGLAWLSWAITLALAIGTIVDVRRAGQGHLVPEDSPVSGHETKYLTQNLER